MQVKFEIKIRKSKENYRRVIVTTLKIIRMQQRTNYFKQIERSEAFETPT